MRKKKVDAILEVRNLKLHRVTPTGVARLLDGVDFKVRRGETLAVIGEDGAGKSTLALALLRLNDGPSLTLSGEVLYDGDDLLELGERELSRLRGNRIALLFSNPLDALDPAFRAGDQLAEVLGIHRQLRGREAQQRVMELLSRAGLADAQRVSRLYPHQLSLAQAQRVQIAMAIACEPDVLIADEPVALLAEPERAEFLALLRELRGEQMALILLTSDVLAASQQAGVASVAYAGRGVEFAPAKQLFKDPKFPYSQVLIAATPGLARGTPAPLPGPALAPLERGTLCSFVPYCPHVMDVCRSEPPPLIMLEGGRTVRCWLY